MKPENRFQGMNSSSLCSLAGRYDNPIPPRFLAPIDSLKIPARLSQLIKETPRRRITVTSSSNEMSTDQLTNTCRCWWGGGGEGFLLSPQPLSIGGFWTHIWRRRERFSSQSNEFIHLWKFLYVPTTPLLCAYFEKSCIVVAKLKYCTSIQYVTL